MKCCNKDLGHGVPYVMLRYWCDTCKTEHLVDAQEMTNYIAQLNAEKHADAVVSRLPDIL
jgi:nucleoside phosphorylase